VRQQKSYRGAEKLSVRHDQKSYRGVKRTYREVKLKKVIVGQHQKTYRGATPKNLPWGNTKKVTVRHNQKKVVVGQKA